MAESSNIEWTDATWNPTTGCTKISPGCAHCYIERTPPFRMAGRKFEGGKIPLVLHADRLDKPLHWRKPKRICVNSLSDLFHEDVPDDFIDKVFAVMALCPQHTFQVLTKRAARMRDYLLTIQNDDKDLNRFANVAADLAGSPCAAGIFDEIDWPFPNVWLGVSVESNAYRGRVAELMRLPAAVRFISAEPLIGPLQLAGTWAWKEPGCATEREVSPFAGFIAIPDCDFTAGPIHWVIVGGESGRHPRPMVMDWAASIIQQCKAAGVPVFMKQVGSNPMIREDVSAKGITTSVWGPIKDSKGGVMEEWPEHLRVREFPETATAEITP